MSSLNSLGRWAGLLLAVLLCVPSSARAQQVDVDEAYALVGAGEMGAGVRALDRLANAAVDPVEASHLRYVAARAEHLAGRSRQALQRYRGLVEQASVDDPWVRRARFAEAELLSLEGEDDEALRVFGAQAEAVLDEARRGELAAGLLGYAHAALDPERGNESIARALFELALRMAPGTPVGDEAEHHVARLSGDTATLVSRIRRDPEGAWACRDRAALGRLNQNGRIRQQVVDGCQVDEIQSMLLDSRASASFGELALLDTALDRFADAPRRQELLERRVVVARAVAPAAVLLEAVDAALPGAEERAIQLLTGSADVLVQRGEGNRARALWTRALEQVRSDAAAATIRRSWASLRMVEAGRARAQGDIPAALERLAALEEEVPSFKGESQLLRASLMAEAGRLDEARALLESVGGGEAEPALLALMEETGALEDALELRRRLWRGERQERLEIAVERTFRADESPELLVATDALTSLELRLHRVDVEDHLRSMRTLDGLGSLDVDLMTPERIIEVDLGAPVIEGYDQPGPTRQAVPLPRLGAGLWAVEVVGATQQGLAVLQVSDLELVARRVGPSLAVLVVDQRRGRPVPGATVVVSDGASIVAEGRAGADGVFRTELASPNLTVLAERNGQAAWTAVSGGGGRPGARAERESEQQLALWLDHDRIRAGETLSLLAWGAAGWAERELPEGELTVRLARNSEVWWEESAEMERGELRLAIPLPPSLPVGRWTVSVGAASAAFDLLGPMARRSETRIEPTESGVDLELRGLAGEPVIGADVRADLGDGRGERVVGRTDEEGRLSIPVTRDPALPPPSVRVMGRAVQFPPQAQAAPVLSLSEDRARVELDAPGWDGAAVHLTVSGSLSSEAEEPLLPAPWHRPPPSSAPIRRHDLSGRVGTDGWSAALPELEAGQWSLALELVAADGQRMRTSQQWTVHPEQRARLESGPVRFQSGSRLPRDVGYRGAFPVRVEGTGPMLLTVETEELLRHQVVEAGARELQLPALVGDAVAALTGVDGGADVERLRVRRRVELEAELEEGRLRVRTRLGDGSPLATKVAVVLRPTSRSRGLARTTLWGRDGAWVGAMVGGTRLIRGRGGVWAIDPEILDAQAEAAFAERGDLLMSLDAEPSMDGFFDQISVEGVGGLGSSGRGSGASGYGRGGGAFGRRGQGTLGSALELRPDPRWRPLVFAVVETDADGEVELPVASSEIETGWYELVVRASELHHSAGSPNAAGGDPEELSKTVWLRAERPLALPAAQAPAQRASATVRLIEAGAEFSLSMEGATRARVERHPVSALGLIEATFGLSAPPRHELAREAALSLRRLAALDPATASALELRARALETIEGRTPSPRFRPTEWQLRQLERLPDVQVAERAELLLGLSRSAPGHPQGQAALLRLWRRPEALQAELVGTLTLASLGLDAELPRRSDLVTALRAASEAGQGRAAEALVLLGERLRVDPIERLAQLDPSVDVAQAGAWVRAALPSRARARGAGAVMSSELRSISGSVQVAAGERAVFARVVLEDGTPLVGAEAGVTLTRQVERPGVWFRGTELAGHQAPLEGDEVALGRPIDVSLEVRGPGDQDRELTIEEPVGAGLVVDPTSVRGGEMVALRDGVLHLRGRLVRGRLQIRYRAEAAAVAEVGSWPAPMLRASGEPLASGAARVFGVVDGAEERSRRVAGQAVLPTGPLRWQEELQLGLMLQRSGLDEPALLREAIGLIEPILAERELAPAQVQEAGLAMLRAALALGEDEAVARAFSILQDRAPRAPLELAELAQAAGAFQRLGDWDYARRAWRAAMGLRFLAEVAAGEGLIDLGLVTEGLHLIHELTRGYPDLAPVRASMFNLPQLLLAQAEGQPDTPEGRFEARRYRTTAARWLGEYVARYSDATDAPEAAFHLATSWSELSRWEELTRWAQRAVRRWPDAPLVDSLLFLRAFGLQRQGQLGEALRQYRSVVAGVDGRASADRAEAQLAIARIHQAEGRLEEALAGYREVAAQFSDAAAAVALLEASELRVPAVVQAEPGEGVTLPMRQRGVGSLRIWAYPVDLERLFLREKQIRAVSSISLAGIAPLLEQQVSFSPGRGALADEEVRLDLREEGAYLVLMSDGQVSRSCLAVVSALGVDVVTEAGSGHVRVNVVDRAGRPVAGARVRAARPGAGQTVRAETDLRGVARVPQQNQQSHVLVQLGASYAVYRGAEEDPMTAASVVSLPSLRRPAEDDLRGNARRRARDMRQNNNATYGDEVLRNRQESIEMNLF